MDDFMKTEFLRADQARRQANQNFNTGPAGEFNGYLTCRSCRRQFTAAYIRAMDAVTCPYPKARVTEAASPLKAYEALAVGRPHLQLVLAGFVGEVRDPLTVG